MKKIFLTIFLFSTINLFSQKKIIEREGEIYFDNTVVVKIKEQNEEKFFQSKILQSISPSRTERVFNETPTVLLKGEHQLNRIYIVEYNSNEDPIIVSSKLSNLSAVEWAEPKYIRKITYEPNDTLYKSNLQQNLKSISASQAWDISIGDTNVVIAIVDTGVDWKHPDISANIYHNKIPDPNYPNDVNGWDFGGLNGTPDNDPSEDYSNRNSYHGTHVAGISSAVTNNKIGIASIGYNCKLLPVKVSRNDVRDTKGYALIVYGFEGIKYAADRGANVINCSWGGYAYSRFEQEVIDYALSKEALVVAAAGNDNSNTPFYPASYKGVLSVGWLNTTEDTKSVQANYGAELDVMAPGSLILSTWQHDSTNNQYYNQFLSGSSMSAPLTAGLAGLVKSRFPNYTPMQVSEQIRVTADNIDTKNIGFEKQLGRGKINAFRALNETNTISLRATNVKFIEHGNGNGIFNSGENFDVVLTLTNFLSKINNLNINVINNDPYIVISGVPISASGFDVLETKTDAYSFNIAIRQDAPLNYKANILLQFSTQGYDDFQWLSIKINPTFDTHNTGKIVMSITSKGALGFNDYSSNQEGQGFKYMNSGNLMFEGAFMYGTLQTKLMDVVRITSEQSKDFKIIAPIKITSPGNLFAEETYSNFDDSEAQNPIGISTHFYTYASNTPSDDNYIIIRTALNNKNSSDINGLYAGFFIDWDIPEEDFENDTTAYDVNDNFAYAYNKKNPNVYVGTALISHTNYGYYAIENSAQSGEVKLIDGFTDPEKWLAISSGIKNLGAGVKDISYVISGGPFNISANKTESIAFSIAAGSTLDEVRTAVKKSREKYKSIPTGIKETENKLPAEFVLYQNYPNPFNPETVIRYQLAVGSHVTLKVYDVLGREVETLVNEYKQAGIHPALYTNRSTLPSGVYFYQLRTGEFVQTKKMVLLR